MTGSLWTGHRERAEYVMARYEATLRKVYNTVKSTSLLTCR